MVYKLRSNKQLKVKSAAIILTRLNFLYENTFNYRQISYLYSQSTKRTQVHTLFGFKIMSSRFLACESNKSVFYSYMTRICGVCGVYFKRFYTDRHTYNERT